VIRSWKSIVSRIPHRLSDRETRKILLQTMLSLLLKVFAGVSGFVLNLVVSRSLGASDAGTFFLGLTISNVVGICIQFGCDQAVLRRVGVAKSAGDFSSARQARRASFQILAIGAGISILVGLPLGLSALKSHNLTEVLPLAVMWLGAIPFAISWLLAHCFLGWGLIAKFQAYQNLVSAALFSLLFLAWQFFTGRHEVLDASILYLLSLSVVAVAGEFSWRRLIGVGLAEAASVRKLAHEAAPLFGIAALGLLMTWGAQVVLAMFAPASDVAVFTVALRTATLVSVVLTAGNNILLPRFASLYAKGEIVALRKLCTLSTRVMLVLCAPALVLMFVFPREVMSLFGGDFSHGGAVLSILALGQLVNVATGAVGGLLNMTGNASLALKANVIAAAFTICAIFLLVPAYGLVGAAVAQALGLALQMILLSVWAKIKLGFMPASLR